MLVFWKIRHRGCASVFVGIVEFLLDLKFGFTVGAPTCGED